MRAVDWSYQAAPTVPARTVQIDRDPDTAPLDWPHFVFFSELLAELTALPAERFYTAEVMAMRRACQHFLSLFGRKYLTA